MGKPLNNTGRGVRLELQGAKGGENMFSDRAEPSRF